MKTFTGRTIQVPFSEDEWQRFGDAMFHYGFKKQNYVRNLIIADLQEKGWLPQNQEEKTAQTAAKEV